MFPAADSHARKKAIPRYRFSVTDFYGTTAQTPAANGVLGNCLSDIANDKHERATVKRGRPYALDASRNRTTAR